MKKTSYLKAWFEVAGLFLTFIVMFALLFCFIYFLSKLYLSLAVVFSIIAVISGVAYMKYDINNYLIQMQEELEGEKQ